MNDDEDQSPFYDRNIIHNQPQFKMTEKNVNPSTLSQPVKSTLKNKVSNNNTGGSNLMRVNSFKNSLNFKQY